MQRLTPVVLTLLFCFIYANGFILKKRSIRSTNVESPLHDALKVIEREKRRVLFDEKERDWNPRADDEYYGWGEEPYQRLEPRYDSYDISQLGDLFNGDIYGDDRQELEEIKPEDWRLLFDEANDEALGDEADEETEPDNAVSKQELADIFQESEDEAGDIPPESPGKDEHKKREFDPSQETEKRSEGSDEDNTLSADQVDSLLKDVDKLELDDMQNDVNKEEISSGDESAVSQDELQDLFNDVDDGEGNEGDANPESDEIQSNQDKELKWDELKGPPNKEWLINQYLAGVPTEKRTSRKHKRSDRAAFLPEGPGMDYNDLDMLNGIPDVGESQEDIAAELAIARADIKMLQEFLALEDEENANLAKALNLATKSQTERTDKYVHDEIDFIKQAISDEMNIKEVKNLARITPDDITAQDVENVLLAQSDDQPQDLLLDTYEKRGYPEIEMDEADMQIPLDIPDDDSVDNINEEISDELTKEDLMNLFLADKLKKMLAEDKMSEDMNGVLGKAKGLEVWYDRPVAPDAEEVESDQEWYINPLMRELWEQLQTSKMNKRSGYADEYEGSSPIDTDELENSLVASLVQPEMCPAVVEMTDGCAFVQQLGLGLDEEATDLCDRHSLCYTCGAVHGLSPEDCDRGYLGIAARLCEGKDSCDDDAANLFLLMLENHGYQTISETPNICDDICTRDYITGGAK